MKSNKFIQNRLTKEGLAEMYNNRYQSHFNFDSSWVTDLNGQEKLEQARHVKVAPYQENLRSFAKKYTSKIFIHKLELLEYISKDFLKTPILYGVILIVYAFLPTNESAAQRAKIDIELKGFIEFSLDNYFKEKKIKAKKWNAVDLIHRETIINELIFTLWNNLIDLKIVKFKNAGKNYLIQAHPTFDRAIFEGANKWFFKDLPMIQEPNPWILEEGQAYGGGYHIYEKAFVKKSMMFVGTLKIKEALKNIINTRLQKMEWSIDENLFKFLDSEFSIVVDALNLNKRIGKTLKKADIYQQTNVYFFLKEFCQRFNKFYFPWSIDHRGRLYPLPSTFSPTSSKKMRQYIILSQPELLNDDGKNWLQLAVGLLNDIGGPSNKIIFDNTSNKIEKIKKLNNSQKFYPAYLTTTMVDAIENNTSNSRLIELDCTNSAFQHIGIATNSSKIMFLTNLSGPGSDEIGPKSAYKKQDLYNFVIEKLTNNLPHEFMAHFLDRDMMKKLIMPAPYGKTKGTCIFDLACFAANNKIFIEKILSLNLEDQNTTSDDDEIISYSMETEYSKYVFRKARIFAGMFFIHFDKVLNDEFPEIEQFKALFRGKAAPMRNFTFSTEYLEFVNQYNRKEKYVIEKTRKQKTLSLTFIRRTDIPNPLKETESAAANYIHGWDAFIVHEILSNAPKNMIIYPIHDAFLVSPNFANLLQTLLKQAYIKAQNQMKEVPAFKPFHNIGTIPIISNNIAKLSVKLENSYENDENIDED